MDDFIYQRQISPSGIAIEEIYGSDEMSAKVWKLFAMQIFSEAVGDYRSISHLENGAPILDDIPQRISISHTPHFLVVASIPKTPDICLDQVNVRTAIGIDIEKPDRNQVIKIRDKFLSPDEQALLPQIADNDVDPQTVKSYILAWTCKEALYKSVMGIAPDWKVDYNILSLPQIADDINSATSSKFGKAVIAVPGSDPFEMSLSSWISCDHVVTLAFSKKIPIFK